ncbi:MAG: conjugal transfer protein TraL [Oscillospiraceae bacterium]|nr:conjugal transfer protein TraL [Oscillospiraceae bacterium]
MDNRVVCLLLAEGLFALFLLWRAGFLPGFRSVIRCSLLIGLALFIRLCYFDRENTDYQWFLKVWVDFYRSSGGFAALDRSIGNYNIPYLYFLALFSYSDIRDLYLIKLLSIFFDILLSYAGLLLVKKSTGKRIPALCCFFTLLYLPTVLTNSSTWGQCDSIYVALALLGLAFALPEPDGTGGKPLLSVIFIAAAFGFKLQAVFLLPLWLLLWLWRKYRWICLSAFPLTYLLMILPAVIAGRPLADAVLIYINQADSIGTALNYNAPSLTALLQLTGSTEAVSRYLILAAFAAMGAVLIAGIAFLPRMTSRSFLFFAALMVLVIPYFLPHMHDRYFYAADCLTVILAFVCLPALPAAVFTQFASFLCYIAYFTGYYQRVGNTGIFLTNDKGAVAIALAILWIAALLLCFQRVNRQENGKNFS